MVVWCPDYVRYEAFDAFDGCFGGRNASMLANIAILRLCCKYRGLVMWCGGNRASGRQRRVTFSLCLYLCLSLAITKVTTIRSNGRSEITLEADGSTVALLGCAVNVGRFGSLGRGRGRVGSTTSHFSLLSHELYKSLRRPRKVWRSILASQGGRRLIEVLRERHESEVVCLNPVGIVIFRSAEDGTGESKRTAGQDRGPSRDKIAVVEGNLAEVGRHVLDLDVVALLNDHELGEAVDSRMANSPLECIEDVHLHLGEHTRVIETTAHVVEFVDLGNTILLVTVLGGDEQCCAADKLVVVLVDDSLGAVAV